jgi:hypothetical protein
MMPPAASAMMMAAPAASGVSMRRRCRAVTAAATGCPVDGHAPVSATSPDVRTAMPAANMPARVVALEVP